jgi:hypothetical protein
VEELTPKLEKPDQNNLKDYAITVHGLKSSSYGVGANAVGDLAKELEARSGAGDMEYVLAHNPTFLSEIDRLVDNIRDQLSPKGQVDVRPWATAPDPKVLAKLALACASFDMDGVEKALRELDAFRYDSQSQLVAWLKEKALSVSFDEMVARLKNLTPDEKTGAPNKSTVSVEAPLKND